MVSKQEARCEAVKIAVSLKETTVENIIDVSQKIADFIIGEGAELPEFHDANAYIKFLADSMEKSKSQQSTVLDDIIKKFESSKKEKETEE